MIYAIDPGPEKSAWLAYDGERVRTAEILPNRELLAEIRTIKLSDYSMLAVEMIASYGMAVGKDVFRTCVWIGRFVEAWESVAAWNRMPASLIERKDVKLYLCQSMRAKDANVRQALIDLFPGTGGGKTSQIGTKSKPGPLYGVSSHLWSALAVAVTAEGMKAKRAA